MTGGLARSDLLTNREGGSDGGPTWQTGGTDLNVNSGGPNPNPTPGQNRRRSLSQSGAVV
ncbi:hypothetical protein MJO28_016812 [Puccinia striiformis f. sp. tritici]|nr:hypothetical protein MJO28_016784 [Puccinia striiformis f. sp. tritici]KAI7935285.1 hypothetical protein MJO28_016812 [Puccinia striiformis f. sp. tritici]